MKPVTAHQPGSTEWAQQRALRVGGSEVAAILGLSPWESHFSLWHHKQAPAVEQDDTPALEWGRRKEPVIAAKFLENHPDLAEIEGGAYICDDHPGHLAHPDLIAENRDGIGYIIEIKTAWNDDHWGPAGTDQIPIYYMTQVRWYMHVLDMDHAWLAVLIGASDYREYPISRNLADETLMVAAVDAFLDSIRDGVRPDIDAHSATYQTIREQHPQIDGTDVEVDPDLAGDYLAAEIEAKHVATALKQAKSRLLDVMGTARNAVVNGERAAYRTHKSTTTTCPGCHGNMRHTADCGTCDGAGTIKQPGTPYLAADKKNLTRLINGENL